MTRLKKAMFTGRKKMTDELKDMLLRYLRDMSERGDHTARQLLPLVEEIE